MKKEIKKNGNSIFLETFDSNPGSGDGFIAGDGRRFGFTMYFKHNAGLLPIKVIKKNSHHVSIEFRGDWEYELFSNALLHLTMEFVKNKNAIGEKSEAIKSLQNVLIATLTELIKCQDENK